jgi:hypothetical protein
MALINKKVNIPNVQLPPQNVLNQTLYQDSMPYQRNQQYFATNKTQ